MKKVFFLFIFSAAMLTFSGCNDDDPGTGRIAFTFNHVIDGQPVIFNDLRYTNAAGNHYEVTEIQWFISDVSLTNQSGAEVALDDGTFSHYVDTNLPGTFTWEPPDRLTAGKYSQIKFTFGLKGARNKPGIFPDLPESNMIWPYAMGGENGGYHYMKLNGFWINTSEQRMPFNFHLGVGQIYDGEGQVTEFVQNWFEVTLPVSFEIQQGEINQLQLTMNVESWFDSPTVYDHNEFGSMIMKNQEAMGVIAQNGRDAFTVKNQNSQ